MGKKYIIEIPEENIGDFIGSTHFLMPYMLAGHMGSHDTGLPIEPYTEPDLEQVRKEAYDDGYNAGFGRKNDTSYQEGLADAWEAARRIWTTPVGDLKKCFDLEEDINGMLWPFHEYTASEAIAKIKEYEQEQEKIKVGDEVERIIDGEVDSKAVFLEENNGYYHCLFWTGRFFTTLSYPKKQFRKTGRHFPEIAAVIEKMRGEQE